MNSSQRQPRSRIFDIDSQKQSDRQQTPITPQTPQTPTLTHSQLTPTQPQKLKHVLQTIQQQTPIVSCHYHPEQVILNFCKNPDCLLPLCAACVTIHQEDHNDQIYPPHFDLLGTCLQEQYNKIVDICNLLAEDIEEIVELKSIVKNHREIQKKKFLDAKENFYKTIDQYMQQLENNLNSQSIKSTDTLLNEINQFHRLQYNRWEDMHRKLDKLNSDKCLRTLIKSYKANKPEEAYETQHQQTLDFIGTTKIDLEEVDVHPECLKEIIHLLKQYISIKSPLQQQQQQQQQQQSPQLIVRQRTQSQQPRQATQVQQPTPQQISQSPIRVLQGFPILQKMAPITAIERMSMPQQLPLNQFPIMGYPQINGQIQPIPQINGQIQSIPLINGQIQSIPQITQSIIQNQQIPSIHQIPLMNQMPQIPPAGFHPQLQSIIQSKQQQNIKPPIANKPQINILQEQPEQKENEPQVIDMKNSKPLLGMAEKYHSKLYDFSPSMDKGF